VKPRIHLLLLLALLVAVLPGNTLAQQSPSISISIPIPNETVSPVEVVVVGTGTALPENNVVVQALDDSGTVLAEEATIVDAPLGGSGEWRTILQLRVAPGTSGQIYAFSQSPADGSILAEASVSVTYGSGALPTEEPPPATEEPPPPTEEPPTPTPTEERPTPVPPIEPPGPEANLTINIPLDGETVSPVEVVVVGTGTALPENNVVVQALDAAGRLLDERATTVNAPLGGSGEWRVILKPGANPGTSGRVAAFASSPADGSIIAESSVDVRYGTAPPTPPPPRPAMSINIPLEGEVVSPYEVVVVGVGTALPENNVVVRALDAAGRILDEQPTSYTAEPGGSGEWRAILRPNVLPGTLGSIYAFSPSPADGSILAEDSVNVHFGTEPPPPVQPLLIIDQPTDGATVNTKDGLVVRGRAEGLFEGNVVVRIRDSTNRTIAQQATTASNGTWSISFQFLIANGTQGSIYAFSNSPVDGSVVADDLVRVTLASDCQVRSDWPVYTVQPGDSLFSIAARTSSSVTELGVANCLPNPNFIYVGQSLHVPHLPGQVEDLGPPTLAIEEPETGAELQANVPFSLTGTATQVLSGTVFVRVFDPTGFVLGETRVEETEAPDEEGQWNWAAELTIPDVTPGTWATLFAYALSPGDGSILTSTAEPVIFGADEGDPYVLIVEPLPYTNLDLDEPVLVTGSGRGLQSNSLMVQAVDDRGRILATEEATISRRRLGGVSEWTAELPVETVTRGRIVALLEEEEDGSIVSEAAVDVQFGDPRTEPSYTTITYPLPGTVFTNQTPYVAITGYADGLPNDTVFVILQDELGEILQLLPVAVDARTGFWWFVAQPDQEIEEDGSYTIRALGASPLSGIPLVSDQVGVRTSASDSLVTGQVTYRQRSALPPDALVRVSVIDESLPEGPLAEMVLGQQVIPTAGRQVPIPFAVGYNSAGIDEEATYTLMAGIEDAGGELLFFTQQSYPVITQGNPTSDVEVVVEPVP
jgi:putative lipoprotein